MNEAQFWRCVYRLRRLIELEAPGCVVEQELALLAKFVGYMRDETRETRLEQEQAERESVRREIRESN